MKNGQSKNRFWTAMVVLNLLALVYPTNMLWGAETQEEALVGVIVLCAVFLFLTVADAISVVLAYSTSY